MKNRACGNCSKENIPYGVDWPYWMCGKPLCDNCREKENIPIVSKWIPTTDLLILRRMGKLIEELSELSAVASRCVIQGIDETDPSSGIVNRLRLESEIADVYAQLDETVARLNLDVNFISARTRFKRTAMEHWEAFFKE
jgi:hypothetical protein